MEGSLITGLTYEFPAGDAVARDRARALYLRDVVKAGRHAFDAIKKARADDALLDLLMLQPVFLKFCRHDRGFTLADPDMSRKAVGPIGRLLHAFDELRALNLDEIEQVLITVEAKVAQALERPEHVAR
jgi:hypothetical protein